MASISTPQPPPVVVGVDRSPSSLGAADYAAAWAVRRRKPLRLVHASPLPHVIDLFGGLHASAPAGEPDYAAIDTWLRELADRVGREHPGLTEIEAVSITGQAASVLIDESRNAAATMVGCRGIGGFAELMLGSTSAQLSVHGYGPILVVRPPVAVDPGPEQRPHRTLGPLLACYDASAASEAALRFAADEAALRDVPLIVANVYDGDETRAKQLLSEAIDPWADDYPGQPIELRPIFSQHSPQYALVEAARTAALTVVGCRGHGGFAGLLLGSVSRALVHHAYGPVAVIHPAEHGMEPQ